MEISRIVDFMFDRVILPAAFVFSLLLFLYRSFLTDPFSSSSQCYPYILWLGCLFMLTLTVAKKEVLCKTPQKHRFLLLFLCGPAIWAYMLFMSLLVSLIFWQNPKQVIRELWEEWWGDKLNEMPMRQ